MRSPACNCGVLTPQAKPAPSVVHHGNFRWNIVPHLAQGAVRGNVEVVRIAAPQSRLTVRASEAIVAAVAAQTVISRLTCRTRPTAVARAHSDAVTDIDAPALLRLRADFGDHP